MRAATIVLLVVCSSSSAWALPVFARRYQTSCTTCHTQFPKLNPFGEAFRRNGYQFPDGGDAQSIQDPAVKVVADARRAQWPDSFWPSEIPSSIPLALELGVSVPIYPDRGVRPAGDQVISLNGIFASAELLFAARLARDFTVWADLELSTDSVELGRAVLIVSNLFHQSALNLKVGQFEPQVLSFSDHRRLGGPAYQILSSQSTHGSWNFEVMRGLDLSGTIGGRFGWNLGYGQGVEGASDDAGIKSLPLDGYAHAYFKLGGLRLDGVDKRDNPPMYERSVQIGGFAYAGRHDVVVDNVTTRPPERDVLYKSGGDLYSLLGKVEILAAAAYEHHRFQLSGTVERVQTLLEVTWRPLPWLAAIARGEVQFSSGKEGARIIPAFNMFPLINLKFQVWGVVSNQFADNRFHFSEIDVAAKYAF